MCTLFFSNLYPKLLRSTLMLIFLFGLSLVQFSWADGFKYLPQVVSTFTFHSNTNHELSVYWDVDYVGSGDLIAFYNKPPKAEGESGAICWFHPSYAKNNQIFTAWNGTPCHSDDEDDIWAAYYNSSGVLIASAKLDRPLTQLSVDDNHVSWNVTNVAYSDFIAFYSDEPTEQYSGGYLHITYAQGYGDGLHQVSSKTCIMFGDTTPVCSKPSEIKSFWVGYYRKTNGQYWLVDKVQYTEKTCRSTTTTVPPFQLPINIFQRDVVDNGSHAEESSLTNSQTNLCLDSSNGNVYTHQCNGNAYQGWNMTPNGTIRHAQSDLCLDSNYEGKVYALACNNGNYQNWERSGSQVRNRQTGRCLDSNYNGEVYALTCNNGNYQNWIQTLSAKPIFYYHSNFQGLALRPNVGDYNYYAIPNDAISSVSVPLGITATLFEHGDFGGKSKAFNSDADYVGNDFNDVASSIKVTKSAFFLVSNQTNQCLDSSNGNVYAGTCNGSNYQSWTRGNDLTIRHAQSGLCLDGNYSGAVYTHECNYGNNWQKWEKLGRTLRNKATGLCLDSSNGNVYANPCYDNNGNAYQKWNPFNQL